MLSEYCFPDFPYSIQADCDGNMMISKIFIEKSVRTWYNVVIRTISEEKMNRTAIVTGGAGGIGAAVCQRLARDGINVVIAFRFSEEKAVHLAEEIRKSG